MLLWKKKELRIVFQVICLTDGPTVLPIYNDHNVRLNKKLQTICKFMRSNTFVLTKDFSNKCNSFQYWEVWQQSLFSAYIPEGDINVTFWIWMKWDQFSSNALEIFLLVFCGIKAKTIPICVSLAWAYSLHKISIPVWDTMCFFRGIYWKYSHSMYVLFAVLYCRRKKNLN